MKNLYMRRWVLVLLMVGLGFSQVTQAQSVSVPYEKSSGSGWETLLFDAKKILNLTVTGSGLTVAASKDLEIRLVVILSIGPFLPLLI